MTFNSKFLKSVMTVLAVAEVCFLAWIFYFHYMCMDHAEHIHAAWLVWQGQVPYRDFFEHHNPLLWFLLAPVVALFYKNALILYFAKFLTLCFYSVALWAFYLIARDFLKISKIKFFLTLILYFLLFDNCYLLFELQPDALMLAFFFWGLWFFLRFNFPRNEIDCASRVRILSIAFLLFTLSFLVLQKILILLSILAGFTLYQLWKRNIQFVGVIKALIPSFFIFSAFLAYLYYTNSWSVYFLFNYDLNFWMQDFMGNAKILQSWMVVGYLPIIAIFSLHHFLADENKIRNLICIIMLLEFIQKMIVGAPYVQYFIFSNLISALIIADLIVDKIYMLRVKLVLLLIPVLPIIMIFYYPPNTQFPRYYKVSDFINRYSRDDEPLINTVFFFFNLYGRNPAYYWFGYGNVAQVAQYLYDIDEPIDINAYIRENMPMFIYAVDCTNLLAVSNIDNLFEFRNHFKELWHKVPVKKDNQEDFANRWSSPAFQTLDWLFLKTFYAITPYNPLLIRKDLVYRLNQH